MTKLILIIDEQQSQINRLNRALNDGGYEVEEAINGPAAMTFLSRGETNGFDLVLLDMDLKSDGGGDILRHIKEKFPNLPVIGLTHHNNEDRTADIIRAGAVDVLVKPIIPSRLIISVENAFRLNTLSGEISRLSRKISGNLGFDDLIGKSDAMGKAINLAQKASNLNVPILLEGESGVGKEVFARAIQGQSDRSGKAFVVVNCGAIPHDLVESILFGHEKGAFTGATERHIGKFVEADGGTLFLDEIGELPLDLQVKLLRVLQEGEVDPVGSRETIKIDVRLIFATNRRLKDMVDNGDFREDLFYRLNIFPIVLPPLRERKGDIDHLAGYFVENISISEGYPLKKISSSAMTFLRGYRWPGNVRQLENALYRAIILSEGAMIEKEDFPQIHAAQKRQTDAMGTVASGQEGLTFLDENGDIRPLQNVEKEMISFALDKYQRSMVEVARRLGIGRSTLYRKVVEFGLERTSIEDKA